jgi:hypothetical protein
VFTIAPLGVADCHGLTFLRERRARANADRHEGGVDHASARHRESHGEFHGMIDQRP